MSWLLFLLGIVLALGGTFIAASGLIQITGRDPSPGVMVFGESIVGQARRILATEPRFKYVTVGQYDRFDSVLALGGSVPTENDKFDLRVVLFEKVRPIPKGIIVNVSSDQFRDAQVDAMIRRDPR